MDARSGRSVEVWADGYSFREVERLRCEPLRENGEAPPVTRKWLGEVRMAAFLIGPLLIEMPQG